MLVNKAFKYRLRTNPEIEQQLRQYAGSCRFAWNKALALQKERFANGEKKLGYAALCKELTSWKQKRRPLLRRLSRGSWPTDGGEHPRHVTGLTRLVKMYTRMI